MAKRRISNKAIVIMKIISALGLIFSICLYLFMNFGSFKNDLGFGPEGVTYRLVFPILLMLGFSFVVYYVGNMIVRVETKQIWKADNMFILYQIVFNGLLLITIWRWFLLNLSNAMIPSMIMILSGILNLCTPKIVDNNNQDF